MLEERNVWNFRQYRDSDLDPVDLPWNVEQHKFNSQTGEIVPGTRVWCATVATEQLARQIAEMLADNARAVMKGVTEAKGADITPFGTP